MMIRLPAGPAPGGPRLPLSGLDFPKTDTLDACAFRRTRPNAPDIAGAYAPVVEGALNHKPEIKLSAPRGV